MVIEIGSVGHEAHDDAVASARSAIAVVGQVNGGGTGKRSACGRRWCEATSAVTCSPGFKC